ncbi:hypothetical protein BDV26DRAFT_49964 [Aspergillus bertholletiae]|uniref:Tat pathway signal sequence n=1 Tax=Aspergillus bertholletiae TaxID=1226010 RepID=A0A5N7AWC3_9EURO|nr:hypothetical protein BDV26DRAFT_49964 [Aspergillus bertholletiae]
MPANYQPLSSDITCTGNGEQCSCEKRQRSAYGLWWPHVLFLGFSIGMGVLTALVLRRLDYYALLSSRGTDQILDREGDRLEAVRFHGTFDLNTPFKGPPSLEVKAAWERLVRPGVLAIGEKEWTLAQPQYPDASVEIPVSNQLTHGRRFMATLEVTHQINCLYNLFKLNYLDYFEDAKVLREANVTRDRERVDHCIDILRQKLLCDADTSLVTYNWVQRVGRPVANFNSLHQCRNFERVRSWAETHSYVSSVDIQKPDHVVGLGRYP